MKLVFEGHDERYTVEQSLLNLFPGEFPVYGTVGPEDENWAVISCREEGEELVGGVVVVVVVIG